MDHTNHLINETIKGSAPGYELAADFTKWAIGGTAAMAGLIISSSTSVIELLGKTGCATALSFLALSLVSGWAAVLASNAVRGAMLGWSAKEKIAATNESKTTQEAAPVDGDRFLSEYINLLWGPLRFMTELSVTRAKKSAKPAELTNANIVGSFTSAYVLFSMLQSLFAFLSIASMVIAIWCK